MPEKEQTMKDQVWVLAKLSDQQLEEVKEAERTLGSPLNILAFRQVDSKVAQLNGSQLDCLQGLEKKLGLALVAYNKTS